MAPKPAMSDATIAKLLLVALSFCWGLSWTAMRMALDEVSPWSMRLIGYSIGAAMLLILLKAQGRSLAIPGGKNWLHVFIAALFLVVALASPAPSPSSWRTPRGSSSSTTRCRSGAA